MTDERTIPEQMDDFADAANMPACPPVSDVPPHENCDAKGIYKRPVYTEDAEGRHMTGFEFVTLDSEPNHRAIYEGQGFVFMGYAVLGAPIAPTLAEVQASQSTETFDSATGSTEAEGTPA